MTWDDAQEILRALAAAGVDFVVIGSMAPETLYRMKRDTVRPQDQADAARIREAFDLGDG